MYLSVLSLIIMLNDVLTEIDRQNIIFDVVDGIPPSADESDEVRTFRSRIETDNFFLEFVVGVTEFSMADWVCSFPIIRRSCRFFLRCFPSEDENE